MVAFRWIGGVVLLSIGSASAAAQQFDPFAGETASAYQLDLARNFYTRAAAAREGERLERELWALAVAAGPRSRLPLLSLLSRRDSIMRRVGKYTAYLSLRTLLDTGDAGRSGRWAPCRPWRGTRPARWTCAWRQPTRRPWPQLGARVTRTRSIRSGRSGA